MPLFIHTSHPSRDGKGVRILRVHGFANNELDPFLMLDQLHSDKSDDYIGGFPPHPHRGIETLTYIRHGGFRHTDSMGNTGEIRAGGVQWMSAGRGVIHAEMPIQQSGLLHGFQLWINLPAAHKLKQPEYQDVSGERLPATSLGQAWLKPLAGSTRIDGVGYTSTLASLAAQAAMADLWGSCTDMRIELAAGRSFGLYAYQGEVEVHGQLVASGQLARHTAQRDEYSLRLTGTDFGALLLSGTPLNEPLAHYGPFVMNTQAELDQAISDYQQGKLAAEPLLRD